MIHTQKSYKKNKPLSHNLLLYVDTDIQVLIKLHLCFE